MADDLSFLPEFLRAYWEKYVPKAKSQEEIAANREETAAAARAAWDQYGPAGSVHLQKRGQWPWAKEHPEAAKAISDALTYGPMGLPASSRAGAGIGRDSVMAHSLDQTALHAPGKYDRGITGGQPNVVTEYLARGEGRGGPTSWVDSSSYLAGEPGMQPHPGARPYRPSEFRPHPSRLGGDVANDPIGLSSQSLAGRPGMRSADQPLPSAGHKDLPRHIDDFAFNAYGDKVPTDQLPGGKGSNVGFADNYPRAFQDMTLPELALNERYFKSEAINGDAWARNVLKMIDAEKAGRTITGGAPKEPYKP